MNAFLFTWDMAKLAANQFSIWLLVFEGYLQASDVVAFSAIDKQRVRAGGSQPAIHNPH